MLKNRVAAARAYLERFGADFIVFTNLCNIRYLSGFTGSDGVLVLGHERGWFLTDSRYTSQSGEEVKDFTVIEYRAKLQGLSDLLQKEGGKRIAFEADHVTVSFYKSLVEIFAGCELIPVGAELDQLRIKKDAKEVELLAICAEIASKA